MDHRPLHQLSDNLRCTTAGRLAKFEHGWRVFNAFSSFLLQKSENRPFAQHLREGDLIRLTGMLRGDVFIADDVEVVYRPTTTEPDLTRCRDLSLGLALQARHSINARIRRFFDGRGFLEVETPYWVLAPGTDPHLEPVAAEFRDAHHDEEPPRRAYLHTSPELQMKRLLAGGSGPIYQLGRVWRNGEVTDLHNPEFTLLEWYRPWRDLEAIIDDVEALVAEVLHAQSPRPVDSPIERMTMQEVVFEACGFDILNALDTDSLRREILARKLLSRRATEGARWDELFFSLAVSHLDPFLKERGALFVTHWPTPLAVLARRSEEDPRVAERFELYVDGVELANGFGELTDAKEQRRRFEEDNENRRQLGLSELPMPEAFLQALKWGLPPSAGVALGVDRLLLLATEGAKSLADVAPFALRRRPDRIEWP